MISSHFRRCYRVPHNMKWSINFNQAEFNRKVYRDLTSTSEGTSGMTYEVQENIMYNGRRKKKTFFVTFDR